MKEVVGLFEGVVTGAADGYYRMAGKPATTLLHLGPGLANGLANLHNARKAQSGVLNVMGEHATYHLRHESPLKGDTAGISQSISHWTRTSADAAQVASDGAAAVQAARSLNGQIATLKIDIDENAGLRPGYKLKLNSYDLGVDVELMNADWESNVDTARTRAERLIQEGAHVLVGPFDSGAASAIAQVAEQLATPQVG